MIEITPPKKAIRAFCKSCIYDSQDKGTWIEQVEACTITKCELYQHRPLTSKTRLENKKIELSKLSEEERRAHNEKQAKLSEDFRARLNKKT